MDLIQESKNIFPEVVRIRRQIHRNPELGEEERETAALIQRELTAYGIPFHPNVAGLGIVGQIGSGTRAVGIRADIDALPISECTDLPYASCKPGLMHACGHDMHTAILLGAARILKNKEEAINRAGGAVKLFFQPAEETIGGAERMIQAGYLQNPDVYAMIALHIDPAYPSGTVVLRYGAMNAETQSFEIRVQGKSCHGAHPDMGIDTIVIAANIVTAIQTISSRYNAPTTPVIVTIGSIHGGDAANAVPGEVIMKGTMRALSADVMAKNKDWLREITAGIAASYGGRADLAFGEDGYPALINDDEITQTVERNARRLLGDRYVALMPEASLGGDDFAFFTRATKGSYFNLGVTRPGEPVYPLHSDHLSPDEEAMIHGIAIECATVLDLLGL